MFNGVGTALVTPFSGNEIDYLALKGLIQRQIKAGVSAIIVLGTTGEPATISEIEREKIIKTAIATADKKIKVIVGCGSNSTSHAIKLYKQAESLGADGALIVTPYYNKCTQKGIIEHYKAIASSGELPIIVYNVPGRTGVNILPETMLSLAKIKNINGVKEASGNIEQVLQIFKLVGSKISIYSGEDSLNAIFMSMGASGTISVLSNVLPKLVVKMCNFSKEKQYEKMFILQRGVHDIIKVLFVEVNPIPVKAALWHLGLCKNELRLPLTKISKENFEKLKFELEKIIGQEYDCL
ncbi:MAG: 4-hydroxy-tetrahydrodipicolinate synthase [Clostridiales bacterium]|nr:4-hydroxy-tetrahydrodipicolinate synthase [Clostridiales bacterium]